MGKKICVITGANSGIGKQAAIQIAKKGYRVIIGCRNIERGNGALKDIKKISASDDVEFIQVDMSLKSSIRKFCKTINDQYNYIDVLIHNAALFDISQKSPIKTAEGYESLWMTNHVGPVLMTKLLLNLLKKSVDGRILTVSSKGLLAMPMLKVDVEDPEFNHRSFSVTKAYYQSKRAQVMYTYWLAKALEKDGISVNSIRVTAVQVDMSRHQNISSLKKWIYKQKSKKSLTPKRMAETYVYLATSSDVKGVTGQYFDENNQGVSSSKYSKNLKNIENVMALTDKYL
ncbi:MAG: SDR family NAD(P)-dependent oxidoreductase [Clostridiaceae bacterium]